MTISRRKLIQGIALSAAATAAPVKLVYGQGAEFTYKYANNTPLTHPMNIRAKQAADAIRAETNGRLDIQIFPSSQLGSDTDTLSQLRSGGVEFFTLSGLILSTLVPPAALNGLGFAFSNYDTVWRAMDGDVGAFIRAQIAKVNLVAMDKIWDNGFRQITTSTKSITTADDLRGLKIRVPVSPMWTSMFKAFDSSPASINASEMYTALQTKVVDAQENPISVVSLFKLNEVQKYCSLTNHMWDGFWFLANKRAWERLPENIRPSPRSTSMRPPSRNEPIWQRSTATCSRNSLPREWCSTRQKPTRSGRNCGLPASMRNGRPSSGTRPGRLSRNTPASSADARSIFMDRATPLSAMNPTADPIVTLTPSAAGRSPPRTPWWMHPLEATAAALILSITVLLLVGVVSRYVFGKAIVWLDEVVSMQFIWAAMIGATIAVYRNEHLRLSVVVDRLPERLREYVHAFALAAMAAVLVALIGPAFTYAHEEWAILTPALNIPNAFRVAAIAFGIVAMLTLLVLYAGRSVRMTPLIVATVLVAAIAGLCWMVSPQLAKLGSLNIAIFLVGFVAVCLAAGVPIAFCFAAGAVSYLAFTTQVPLLVVVGRMDEGISSLVLVSVPIFVLLGCVLDATGMGKAIVDFLASLLGHIKAGMSYVLLGSLFIVSGISGSKVSDMATVAPALFPEMKRRGHKGPDMVALLATGAAMADTVPPSIVLIVLGAVAGVSIAGLFKSGFVVAMVLLLSLLLLARWKARHEDMSGTSRAPIRSRWPHAPSGRTSLGAPVPDSQPGRRGRRDCHRSLDRRGDLCVADRAFHVRRPWPAQALHHARGNRRALRGRASRSRRRIRNGLGHHAKRCRAATVVFLTTLPGGPIAFMAVTIVVFVVAWMPSRRLACGASARPDHVPDREEARDSTTSSTRWWSSAP